MITMDSNTAWNNFFKNIYSTWYEPNNLSKNLACFRVRDKIFKPYINPKFKIKKEDKIFAIGSCFARRIEEAFQNIGFEVLSLTDAFNKFIKVNIQEYHYGILNKFHTYSILNDIIWAGEIELDINKYFIKINEGNYKDLHAHDEILKDDILDIMIERRKIINNLNMKIFDADIIILTLGLVEAWYDKKNKCYINITPSPKVIQSYPKRFEFRVLSYRQNLNNLIKVYNLLKLYNKNFKIIITVSPVPLKATFRRQDVVIANFYSKCLLRCVAEDFANKYDNVDYFPSFEIAQLSDPEIVWEEDQRHVDQNFTSFIVEYFLENYLN